MTLLSKTPQPSARHQCLVAALLASVAALVLFWSLDAGRMEPDESLYALATDHIRQTGEVWTLSTHPPSPYFNKPPLYMWLSAATYDLLPGFAFKYRFWSALFGVIAVVLTGVLGSRLLNPILGFIAGLLLLTNRSFLTDHGARFGGMDAGLAACMTGIALVYLLRLNNRRRTWQWVVIGLLAGVASLLKPLGGLPMLAVIGLHAILFRRIALETAEPAPHPLRLRSTLLGLLTALLCAIVVAGPWYLVNYIRYPHDFIPYLFGQQIVDAVATEGIAEHQRGWSYYWLAVPTSSRHFLLVAPAVAWGMWVAIRNPSRRPILVLLLLGTIGWIAGFSLAGKKFLHYTYPAFGLLAILIAAWLGAVVRGAGERLGDESFKRSGRFSAMVHASIAALLTLFAVHQALVALPRKADLPATWLAYQASLKSIEAGEMQVLSWGVPHRPNEWPAEAGVRPQQMIYLSHMPQILEMRETADLAARVQAKPRSMIFVASRFEEEAMHVISPGLRVDSVRVIARERSHVLLEVTPEK